MLLFPLRRPDPAESDRNRISRVQPGTDDGFAGAPGDVRGVGRSVGNRVRLPTTGRQTGDHRQTERAAEQMAEGTDQRPGSNGRERVQKGQLSIGFKL